MVLLQAVCVPHDSALSLRARGLVFSDSVHLLRRSWMSADSSKDASEGGRARGRQANRVGQEAGRRKDRDGNVHQRRSKCRPSGLGPGRQQPAFLGMETEGPWWCP